MGAWVAYLQKGARAIGGVEGTLSERRQAKLGRRKRGPRRGGGQIEAGGAGLESIRVKEMNMIENNITQS